MLSHRGEDRTRADSDAPGAIRRADSAPLVNVFGFCYAKSRSWDRIGGLIETQKMIDAEPYAGLNATLQAIHNGQPNRCIDELLT